MGQQQQRGGDRRSFRDLAQLASPPPPRRESISEIRERSGSGDSGMIDLNVLAASDPGAVDRASVTPLASSPLFDVDESPTAPRISPVPAPLASRPTTAPVALPSAPMVSAQAALRAANTEGSPRRSMGRAVVVVGLLAAAAGAVLAVRTLRPHASQAAQATTAPEGAAVLQSAPMPQAPVAAAAPGTPAPTPVAAADRGVDPFSLPSAKKAGAPRTHAHGTHAAHGAVAAVGTAADDDDTEAPAAAEPAKVEPKAEAKVAAKDSPAPSTLSGSLGDAINQAAAQPVAAAAAPIAPAASGGSPDATSQHPSAGAMSSALHAVIPEAQKCLGPDDGVSRVRVVFTSNGSVQSTDLTGFSAGKPSEACIKAALSKGHVPPFAEATYGATVTIRP